jgi:predicted ATPase/class 3 adenylate cyclase
VLPSGIITFLFTDIEGSTRLLQFLGDGYAELLNQHNQIMRSHLQAWDGFVVDSQGDAFFAVFSQAADAVAASAAIQRSLTAQTWPQQLSVPVRIGLHTGKALLTKEGHYIGLDIHRAARIFSAGHGGQVLLSEATCNLVLRDLPFGVSLRDLGEHRLKDLDHPERLYQLVIPSLPADFPPLRSLEAFIHNLPTPPTSFIGREQELAEIKRLLATTPLLTLIGPGGTGKTRLTIQVATELVDTFKDGVRFVELAPVSDPAHLPQTIAATLGLREEPGYPLSKTISDYLRPKTLLLILDNCEHLITACAQLAGSLLQQCPKLKIIASSREALAIGGELTFQVPSLALPPIGSRHQPPLETLTQYAAVRLFIERAITVLPAFTANNDNAPLIAQICHQLDGIPLAIELAAARVKSLQIEQIAERLDDRFRLLRDGSGRTIPRQQTLKALIDWSHNLLSAGEQTLFRRLSVFAGGWTLEAAESVCATPDTPHSSLLSPQSSVLSPQSSPLDPYDILDLLAQLANKSLVVVERIPGEEVRYHFLETIRQYAREKLLEANESEAVRHQHWAFYTALAETSDAQVRGPGQKEWLHRLELEHDNIRAALDWAIQATSADSVWLPPQQPPTAVYGLRLAVPLWGFWFLRGYTSEGLAWLQTFLDRAAPLPTLPVALRAKALARTGFMAYYQNQPQHGRDLAQEAIPLCRQSGDVEGEAIALHVIGSSNTALGNHEQAIAAYQESLALFRASNNDWGIAIMVHLLGQAALQQNNLERAETLGRESLLLRRKLGLNVGTAVSLELLAGVARVRGQSDEAATLLQESLALCREVKSRPFTARILEQLGSVAGERDDLAAASQFLQEALTLQQELGNKVKIAELYLNLGLITGRQGHTQQARDLLTQSQQLWQELNRPANLALVQQALANLPPAPDIQL